VFLKTLYKGGIDFGLRPEDTKSGSKFEISNLGPSDLPICISIEQVSFYYTVHPRRKYSKNFLNFQDSRVSCFFLMVPQEEGGEMQLSSCMAFTLPGTKDKKQTSSFQIEVIFLTPSLQSIPGKH
jgi:hypothetical protein